MKRPKRGPYKMPRHEVVQPLDQSYRLIPLTKGQNAIVDVTDFERVSHWNWRAQWSKDTKSFYAFAHVDGRYTAMSAFILGYKRGEEGDHRNHDTLDNRRENIRKSTQSQNRRNHRKRRDNTSGYTGVSLECPGKWRSRAVVDGKRIALGWFDTPEEAARAYDEAVKIHYGEFAQLNFPTSPKT